MPQKAKEKRQNLYIPPLKMTRIFGGRSGLQDSVKMDEKTTVWSGGFDGHKTHLNRLISRLCLSLYRLRFLSTFCAQ